MKNDHAFDHVSWSYIIYDVLKLNSLTGVNTRGFAFQLYGLLSVRLLIKDLTQ